jgi:hypothetical protein
MRYSKYFFLVTLVSLILSGCDYPIASDYQEQIVVGAFLYSGAPIDSVVLHRTTPLADYYDDTDYAVTGAQVTVTVDGVAHTLKPLAEKGRYYLPASELIVQGGKTYTLSIVAPNLQSGGVHNISASTIVPMPIHLSGIADSIHGLTFTLDTNNLSTFAFLVTATPTDLSDSHYLLSVTALDTSFGRVHQGNLNADSSTFTRYSQEQTGPNIAFTPNLVRWYGPNLMTMYAIDTNWWDYQRQVGFGGSDYQPTLNHVVGGMGVFASASRDTVSVFVKPKQ